MGDMPWFWYASFQVSMLILKRVLTGIAPSSLWLLWMGHWMSEFSLATLFSWWFLQKYPCESTDDSEDICIATGIWKWTEDINVQITKSCVWFIKFSRCWLGVSMNLVWPILYIYCHIRPYDMFADEIGCGLSLMKMMGDHFS